MIPTVLYRLGGDVVPCSCGHLKDLEEADFINISFTKFVALEGILAESATIVGFEATNDPSIQRLDPRGEIWTEIDDCYVCRLIVNVVAGEVVEVEADLAVLLSHLIVEVTDPSVQCSKT